jgi:DNA-directed RNA polymerase alpha subunit
MSSQILKKLQIELQELITTWAEKRKILGPHETLKVNVEINKISPVTIDLSAHLDYKGTQNVDDMSVNELELSVRTANCLNNENIETVGQLRQKTVDELLEIKNLGKRSLTELQVELKRVCNIDAGWLDQAGRVIRHQR